MVTCSVLMCKNNSKCASKQTHKVSYYKFPKDEERRELWAYRIGRHSWKPSSSSVVCSDHFNEDSFYITKNNSLRRLHPDAAPSRSIPPPLHATGEDHHLLDEISKSTRETQESEDAEETENDESTPASTNNKDEVKNNEEMSIIQLKSRLKWFRLLADKRALQIKTLRQSSRRHEKKISDMENALKSLYEKYPVDL